VTPELMVYTSKALPVTASEQTDKEGLSVVLLWYTVKISAREKLSGAGFLENITIIKLDKTLESNVSSSSSQNFVNAAYTELINSITFSQ
jgi:hypothetical protein